MLSALLLAAATMLGLVLVQRALRQTWQAKIPRTASAGLLQAAEIFGVFLIASSAAAGCARGESLLADAGWIAAFGVTAVALLEVAGLMGLRLYVKGQLPAEIAADNAAAGLVAMGHVLATGIIAASLFYGVDLGELGVSLVFFVIAQASLHGLVWLFRRLTAYDDAEEVLDRNLAAALAHAGLTVALAIVIGHAADGPYLGFLDSLLAYGGALLVGLAFYPVRQLLVQCVILGARPSLRGGALDRAIGEAHDIGAGALEAATYVATAFMVGAIV
jgi:uncharacterized membrane protein YjfL (UPF0719 family)